MDEETPTDELLMRYALGMLSEQEQERVEERVFADSQFFERLLVVEDELIDAYASGSLTEHERERFQRYFLKSKDDLDRVRFARELAARTAGKPDSKEMERSPSKWARWIESLRTVPLAFVLTPQSSRSKGETLKFLIPPGARSVRLLLSFTTGDYRNYRAEVQTVEGTVLFECSGDGSGGEDTGVSITVPAEIFRNDDYIVVLHGVTAGGVTETVAEYAFRVL